MKICHFPSITVSITAAGRTGRGYICNIVTRVCARSTRRVMIACGSSSQNQGETATVDRCIRHLVYPAPPSIRSLTDFCMPFRAATGLIPKGGRISLPHRARVHPLIRSRLNLPRTFGLSRFLRSAGSTGSNTLSYGIILDLSAVVSMILASSPAWPSEIFVVAGALIFDMDSDNSWNLLRVRNVTGIAREFMRWKV